MVSCGIFFFTQKTAYERRISDWRSDVCSSDLAVEPGQHEEGRAVNATAQGQVQLVVGMNVFAGLKEQEGRTQHHRDRKSVVEGKSVSVRVDLGGRRIIKNKKRSTHRVHTHT